MRAADASRLRGRTDIAVARLRHHLEVLARDRTEGPLAHLIECFAELCVDAHGGDSGEPGMASFVLIFGNRIGSRHNRKVHLDHAF